MNKMFYVTCLDTLKRYGFTAATPYEVIKKMLYTLNIEHEDKTAKIELHNARTLALIHNGKTYAITI